MTTARRLDTLIGRLLCETGNADVNIPDTIAEKRKLLRALMNVRPPLPVDPTFLKLQDEELGEQLNEKGIICCGNLPATGRLALWQGDITRLDADAIVNAANSRMLGCFVPLHGCIDNAIHSAAGVQLRIACAEIMDKKGRLEPTGTAVITPGFNLPAKFVIHTVGPIVTKSEPTEKQIEQLASCYSSCLEVAESKRLHSIAFCCISTGEFHFPNRKAAEIATSSVSDYFRTHPDSSIKKVVFNVFKDTDKEIYTELLKREGGGF